jgi:ferredoxin-NADP reductase
MSTYSIRVAAKRQETVDAVSLWLEVPTDLRQVFDYRPGQFISISADIGGEEITRQYSLSSSPGQDDALRITVKKVPGGRMSTWLVDEVSKGDVIEVAPPRGRFFKPLDGAHRVVLLAAGSGIAPILPIARRLLAEEPNHNLILAYGSRDPDEILLREEVDALPASFEMCRLEHVLSRANGNWDGARGRIDRDFLTAREGDWHGTAGDLPLMVYLCGPESFMDAAESYFLSRGLDQSAIRRESFDLVLDDDDDEEPLIVAGAEDPGEVSEVCDEIVANVGGERARVAPEPGESILAALIRADAPVPYSCQEGTCSSCIAKMKLGTASVRPGVLKSLRQDDLDEGLVLACLAKPASKNILIDFDDI